MSQAAGLECWFMGGKSYLAEGTVWFHMRRRLKSLEDARNLIKVNGLGCICLDGTKIERLLLLHPPRYDWLKIVCPKGWHRFPGLMPWEYVLRHFFNYRGELRPTAGLDSSSFGMDVVPMSRSVFNWMTQSSGMVACDRMRWGRLEAGMEVKEMGAILNAIPQPLIDHLCPLMRDDFELALKRWNLLLDDKGMWLGCGCHCNPVITSLRMFSDVLFASERLCQSRTAEVPDCRLDAEAGFDV
jgi:hypothetical protein